MANLLLIAKKSIKFVNYEPVLFFLAIGFGVIGGAWQTFLYYRQCIDLWVPYVQNGQIPLEILDNFCQHVSDKEINITDPALSWSERQNRIFEKDTREQMDAPVLSVAGIDKKEAESMVQHAAANLAIYLRICYNVPTLVTALFAGALSDSMGRKPVYLMVLTTITFGYLIYIITAVQLVGMSVYWLCCSALIVSTLGSSMAAMASCFSGFSDMSSSEGQSRNLRMAYGNATNAVGGFVGVMVTSQVLRITEDYGLVWLILVSGFTVSAMWMFLIARETVPKKKKKTKKERSGCQTFWHLIKGVGAKIRDAVKTMVVKRKGGRRVKVIVGLFAFGFGVFFGSGKQ